MKSWTDRRFQQAFQALPQGVREQVIAAYRLFRADPFHSSLQFKSITGSGRIWSVRVGRHYRALGRREGDTVVWFWVGTHAEYDLLVRRLR